MNRQGITVLLNRKIVNHYVLPTEELRKILTKVIIEPEKNCWFYNEDWSVYATYKKHRLHRLMFQIFKEKIEDGKLICHKCDRPGCINPSHLYQGNAKNNYQDAIKRGRIIRTKVNNRKDPLKIDRLRELDRIRSLRRFAGEP